MGFKPLPEPEEDGFTPLPEPEAQTAPTLPDWAGSEATITMPPPPKWGQPGYAEAVFAQQPLQAVSQAEQDAGSGFGDYWKGYGEQAIPALQRLMAIGNPYAVAPQSDVGYETGLLNSALQPAKDVMTLAAPVIDPVMALPKGLINPFAEVVKTPFSEDKTLENLIPRMGAGVLSAVPWGGQASAQTMYERDYPGSEVGYDEAGAAVALSQAGVPDTLAALGANIPHQLLYLGATPGSPFAERGAVKQLAEQTKAGAGAAKEFLTAKPVPEQALVDAPKEGIQSAPAASPDMQFNAGVTPQDIAKGVEELRKPSTPEDVRLGVTRMLDASRRTEGNPWRRAARAVAENVPLTKQEWGKVSQALRTELTDRTAAAKDAYAKLTGQGRVGAVGASKNYTVLDDILGTTDRVESMTETAMSPLADLLGKGTKQEKFQRLADAETIGLAERTIELVEREGKPNAAADYLGQRRDIGQESPAKAKSDANKLTGLGKKLGVSDYEAAVLVMEEAKRWAPERKAAADAFNQKYREVASSMLDMMERSGLRSAEEIARIRNSSDFYYDLHRVVDDIAPGYSKGGGTVSKGSGLVKKLRGSGREVNSPVANLMKQYAEVARASDRRTVLNSFMDAVVDKDFNVTPQAAEMGFKKLKEGQKSETAVTLYESAKAPERAQLQGGYGADFKQKAAPRTVEHRIEIPPDIYKALQGGEYKLSPGMAAAVVRGIASVKRAGVTVAPAFKVMNVFRDAFERSILSEAGGAPWDVVSRDYSKSLAELKEAGGSQGGYGLRTQVDFNRALDNMVKATAKDTNTIIMGVKGKYKYLSELSEQMNRTAEYRNSYKKAIKDGASEADARAYAAYQAKNLLNFERGGNAVKFVNQFVPFSNASVQGLARVMKSNPRVATVQFAKYILLPKLAEYAWNKSQGTEDEWRQLNASQRDFFLNFKVGDNKWLRVPMGYSFAPWASLATRGIDSYVSGNPAAFDGVGSSLAKSLVPMDDSWLSGPLSGVLEAMFNKSLWTGADIVPSYEKDRPVAERKGAVNASDLGKALSPVAGKVGELATKANRALGGDRTFDTTVDPRIVDHIIKAQFGHVGRYMVDAGKDNVTKGDMALRVPGLLALSPGYSSPDVQWVLDYAKREGKGQEKLFKRFKEMMHMAESEKDPAVADKLKQELLSTAATIREVYGGAKR